MYKVVMPELRPGCVWLVGAGPGDPSLLTLLALHALESAEVILHDALISREILALASPTAHLVAVGKRAGRPSPKQLSISQQLVRLARAGRRVVRLKGGDPMVFARGGEECLALAAASVPFRIVPGITAATGVAAAHALPLTHRSVARSLVFVTGHEADGPQEPVDWTRLAAAADTLVVYMGLRQLARIAGALIRAGRAPSEPILIVTDGTQPGARRYRLTLADAALGAPPIPPDASTLVVIGASVGLMDSLEPWLDAVPAHLAVAGSPAAPAPLHGGT